MTNTKLITQKRLFFFLKKKCSDGGLKFLSKWDKTNAT